MNKKTVAVIGANGFVGSEIVKSIQNISKYELISIFRDSNIDLIQDADIVVYAANPAKRYRAENNPLQDFYDTVEKTLKFFKLSKDKKFVLVSSLSCRTQLNTNYGRNRRFCEIIVDNGDSLIIRLGPMFGGNRKEDVLHDILASRPVFVSEDTCYSYVNVSWVGDKIVDLMEKESGIKEIGANGFVRLGDLRDRFSSKSIFSGIDDTQIPDGFHDGPDINDIFTFIEREVQGG